MLLEEEITTSQSRGNILVYDNVIAQHGKQPWKGEKTN
jgi:hypothetical protein